ncbi:MAG: DUF1343 domain-containing protein [Acidaminococcales bacterium]|jgi:uncharacterized protein YbbC (DUF1343 family)|nr:DUF1343 domain-containing protein [Acidaminococcales bacterium]
MRKNLPRIFLILFMLAVSPPAFVAGGKGQPPPVKTGLERIDEFAGLFAGKRIGLITNATGVDKDLNDSAKILAGKMNLTAIFSPEHGYLGQAAAGGAVGAYFDGRLGVPVYSLYGAVKKPTAQMLENVDMLVFDIQDIGVRNYTYLSTMVYAMQACAEEKKQFAVLDRPNPLGGKMEGPVLKAGFESFVGLYPIPFRHGLTPGEAALFYNGEFAIGVDLFVVPLSGWTREMYFEETGLPWVMTSPNIPTLDSVIGYAATGAFAGLGVTNGVGTTRPFEFVGAPWIDPYRLARLGNQENLPGVIFRPVAFTPAFGGYAGKTCYGVQLHFTDKKKAAAVETGVRLFYILRRMAGVDKIDAGGTARLDKNLGENSVWDNLPLEELLVRWREECAAFSVKAQPYLLYEWGGGRGHADQRAD